MKVKGWQIVVIVLGLLVGGGSVVYSLSTSGDPDIEYIIHAVDVETGVLYRIDTIRFPVVIPAPHPESGRFCLVRLLKEEDGVWRALPGDLNAIKNVPDNVIIKAVDPETGELKGALGPFTDYLRK